MSRIWRSLGRGLHGLLRRRAADAELDEEIRHYLEESAADLEARGLPPDEARRAARAALGSRLAVRDQVRESRWEHVLETLIADVRQAARRLWHEKGFAATGVATLALGIGASTAIFSAVHPILLAPLPYPESSRIAAIQDVSASGAPIPVTFGTYLELNERTRAFDALAVFRPWQPTILGGVEPERLEGQRVSADYFDVLGIAPAQGRPFRSDEDRVRGPRLVVLSDGLWRRRFGRDPSLVGREIDLDTGRYLVTGIMPAAFENVTQPAAELWTPLQYDTVLTPEGREWGHHLGMIGRVASGLTLADAGREASALAGDPLARFPRVPWASLQNGLSVRPLRDQIAGPVRPLLFAVGGAVTLLLAIVCANVASLLLARGTRRRGELALRMALGASRGRLIRQLLVESLLLAVAGGGLGIAVAGAALRAIVALSPPELPRAGVLTLDATVLVFALALSAGAGVLVGLVPAFQTSRVRVTAGVEGVSRRAAGRRDGTRRLLVVAEVALALALVAGAGLLLRSLQHLFAIPVGFEPDRVLTLQVQTAGARFGSDAARLAFFDQALTRVLRIPGVESAGWTSQLPLSGDLDGYGVHFERRGPSRETDESALRYAVTPGYFDAMRIPLQGGRRLDAHDAPGQPRAALLSESMAARLFGGTGGSGALGQRLRIGPDEGDWYTVVGIVGDVTQTSVDAGPTAAVYVATGQWHWADPVLSLVIRSRGDAASLAPAVRQAIWSVDRDQPILRVALMETLIARTESARRFALRLFEGFALAAVALASLGLYGVLAGSVEERTREMGIRSALGASRAGLLGLVVRQGMGLTLAGVALGLGLAALAGGALQPLLYGVSAIDMATYVGGVAALSVVSIFACLIPAWRAARIDPAITLRAE